VAKGIRQYSLGKGLPNCSLPTDVYLRFRKSSIFNRENLKSKVSSHHIVRDQQEPALILVDLDTFPFDLLGQVLEWAPFTVCGDDALDQALAYGINLDVVYSNRQNAEELLAHFPGIVIVRPKENWIEEAVLLLASKGHKAVNVVASDDILDLHVLHRMSSFILMDIVTPSKKYIRVEREFSKWLPAGSQLAFHGKGSFDVNDIDMIETNILVKEEGMITVKGDEAFILGMDN